MSHDDTAPERGPESPEAQIAYTKWLTQLRADMAETVGGVLLRGARAVQVGTTPDQTGRTSVTPHAATSAAVLMGYSFALLAAAGAAPGAGTLRIRDGQHGPAVLTLNLFDDALLTQWFGPGGINFSQGIFVEADSAVTGSLFLRGSD